MELYRESTLERLETRLALRRGKEVDLRTHNLEFLLDLAGAYDRLLGASPDSVMAKAFRLCFQWSPSWRYNPLEGDEDECALFFEAAERVLRFITHSL